MTIQKEAPRRATVSHRAWRWSDLDWPVVIGIGAVHVGALAAPFYFSWSGVVLFILLSWVTHRSFKTAKWFEYLLATIGCAAWQGTPVQWVGTHRLHHKHSDHDDDPHTPNHGFAWAHVFWCLMKNQGAMVNFTAADAARDLCRDRGIRMICKLYLVPQFVVAGLCLLGGWWFARMGFETSAMSWFIWGVCVRTTVVYHVTWFINSAAHTWGYRNYDTNDRSTNVWWLGLIGWGEGWHNNHHGDQRAAAHGRRWFELDLTYMMIKGLSWIGLAREIVPARAEMTPPKAATKK
jgi:sn-1 stearoyl-lipid 9-desaturase